MKRLLIYPALALMLIILVGSTTILLLTPETLGFVRGGDARATQSVISSTSQAINSTAQFLADLQAREFELAITRTAVLTMTDETAMTNEAQFLATRVGNVNQTQRTQQAQSTEFGAIQSTQQAQVTQLNEAQNILMAQQTVLASTVTMSSLVNLVTMTAGAEFSAGNFATQQALIGAQANIQNTALALQATGEVLLGQINNLAGTQSAIISTQNALVGTQDAIIGTQTAIAGQNIATATQNAVNFAMTQSAVNQQATQNALDFVMTQSAINQNATQVSLGFATPLPSPMPTLSPTPTAFVDTFGGNRP